MKLLNKKYNWHIEARVYYSEKMDMFTLNRCWDFNFKKEYFCSGKKLPYRLIYDLQKSLSEADLSYNYALKCLYNLFDDTYYLRKEGFYTYIFAYDYVNTYIIIDIINADRFSSMIKKPLSLFPRKRRRKCRKNI